MAATKLEDMNEHLFEMAERLLDTDEICIDDETTKREVEKAKAMVDIANAVVSLQDVGIKKAEVELRMFRLAESIGIDFVPPTILRHIEQEKEAQKALPPITGKKKLK